MEQSNENTRDVYNESNIIHGIEQKKYRSKSNSSINIDDSDINTDNIEYAINNSQVKSESNSFANTLKSYNNANKEAIKSKEYKKKIPKPNMSNKSNQVANGMNGKVGKFRNSNSIDVSISNKDKSELINSISNVYNNFINKENSDSKITINIYNNYSHTNNNVNTTNINNTSVIDYDKDVCKIDNNRFISNNENNQEIQNDLPNISNNKANATVKTVSNNGNNKTKKIRINLSDSNTEVNLLFKKLKNISMILEEDFKDQLCNNSNETKNYNILPISFHRQPNSHHLTAEFNNNDKLNKINTTPQIIDGQESTSRGRMLKEIEDYIEKNMQEMYKEINSLKLNYEEEINELDGLGNAYITIQDSLKEEMNNEVDNMKAQYENLRIKGVEHIVNRYKQKKTKLKRLSMSSTSGINSSIKWNNTNHFNL